MKKQEALILIEEAEKLHCRPGMNELAAIERVKNSETVSKADAYRIERYYCRATGGWNRVFREHISPYQDE